MQGDPRPKITWMKDGQHLIGDRYIKRELEDEVCQLVIREALRADTGAYVCIAENKLKREQIAHFVEFEGREAEIQKRTAPIVEEDVSTAASSGPKKKMRKGKKAKDGEGAPVDMKKRLTFVSHLTDRMVPTGSRMRLMCLVNGPEPNIKWTRNGAGIVFGARVKNATKEGTALIEFQEVLAEDVGEWRCTAKNPSGEISTVCNLTVFDMPPTDVIPPTFSRPISGKLTVVLRMFSIRSVM